MKSEASVRPDHFGGNHKRALSCNSEEAADDGRTLDRTPTLRFAAVEAPDLDHFECAVDARPFKLCASPKTVRPRLSFRRHAFLVRAVDKAGNADQTPARSAFKVRRRG